MEPPDLSAILPNNNQELLLRAALLLDEGAWKQWQVAVDPQNLDATDMRLLPLLHTKLDAFQTDEPLRAKIVQAYQQTRMKNQLMLSDLSSLVASFQQAGIPTLILKGSALILQYYKDPGLRPMVDLDILVPTHQALTAIHHLQSRGYDPESELHVEFSDRLAPFLHGYAFRAKGRAKVDLHWHVLSEWLKEKDDDEFWNASQKIIVQDETSRALNPADQILHLCVHGFKYTIPPSIRWIPDVMTILNSDARIDWERVGKQSNERHLVPPLRHSLEYLKRTFAAPIPDRFFQSLDLESPLDIAEFHSKIRKQKLLGNLPSLWYSYRRRSDRSSLPAFLRYIQEFWGVKHFWLLPFEFARRFYRRSFRKKI